MELHGGSRRLRGKDRLVPIAEFADVATADEAWARLDDDGIPASVVTDAAVLGNPEVTRVYVESPNVERAQALIADLFET